MSCGDMERPPRDVLLELAKVNPEAIVDLVYQLFDMVESLQEKVKELEAKVSALQKNSRNSSKPPSSDQHNSKPPVKGKSRKGNRNPGGQKGHHGHTLSRVENPDYIVDHPLPKFCGCGMDLENVQPEGFQSRQVFDLPVEISIETTEHRAAFATCPCCGKKVRTQFPNNVNAPVQYGPSIRTLATYLHAYQLLPCERVAECFGNLFGWYPSPGTISNFLEQAGQNAAQAAATLKEQIRNSRYIHLDETSLSLSGQKHWLYTASTEDRTYLYLHKNRSREALAQFGVLEGYEGFAIHDFYSIYLPYDQCRHGLCNAHHLRDLKYVEEELGQAWAGKLAQFLVDAKELKEQAVKNGTCLDPSQVSRLRKKYMRILMDGIRLNPEPERKPGKRGKPKRGKALNLLGRLVDREQEVLAFLYHDVPFDNNQAERDLRMMKTKQKISGCFRSLSHANAFINIRSLIASAKKQAVNVMEVLRAVIVAPDKVESLLAKS